MSGIPLLLRNVIIKTSLRTLLDDRVCFLAPGARKTGLVEQDIHVLKRQTLGLRDERESEEDTEKNGESEQEKGAVGDIRHHVRCRVNDGELSKPLVAGREQHAS